MALNIKDPETDRLAREVARRTGESITEAVQHALEMRLRMLDDERRRRVEDLNRIAEEAGRLPVVDDRPIDELVPYDEHGAPA